MKTTIDKAGRVVIPVVIRAKARLQPGTELDVQWDGLSIRLVRAVPPPKIVRRGKRLVVRPTSKIESESGVDVSALIEEERNRWPW